MNVSTDDIPVIQSLIKISTDGELGFRNAAENTDDENLKSLFINRSQGCHHAVVVLQKHAEDLGVESSDNGSVLGTLHRGWIDVLSAITNSNNQAILAECERGESAAKETYREALTKDLSPEIRAIVESQYAGVIENYKLISDLKEKYTV